MADASGSAAADIGALAEGLQSGLCYPRGTTGYLAGRFKAGSYEAGHGLRQRPLGVVSALVAPCSGRLTVRKLWTRRGHDDYPDELSWKHRSCEVECHLGLIGSVVQFTEAAALRADRPSGVVRSPLWGSRLSDACGP